MEKHQIIFEKIKILLTTYFGDRLIQHENGTHLSIDNAFFISYDKHELQIGYGFSCLYYNPKFDDLSEFVGRLFNLLTSRIKITNYLKDEFIYKHKVEIELDNLKFIELGTTSTWLYPFWKTTIIHEIVVDRLIDRDKLIGEIKDIYNLIL